MRRAGLVRLAVGSILRRLGVQNPTRRSSVASVVSDCPRGVAPIGKPVAVRAGQVGFRGVRGPQPGHAASGLAVPFWLRHIQPSSWLKRSDQSLRD